MIGIIYKIARRFSTSLEKILLRMRISSYYHLSQKRFILGKGIVAGSGFSVASDLTNTYVNIGADFRVRDNFHITLGHEGKLRIGERCFFSNDSSVNCLGDITIGNDCQFGEQVLLYDHNHKFKSTDLVISEQGYNIGSIRIGNNCWIGSQVVILKDVVIGDNVVIGAGCVIHQSIPSGTVVYHQQNLVSKPNNK